MQRGTNAVIRRSNRLRPNLRIGTIDRKIDLHRRKRAVLEDLFKALLHKLMTGGIRVGELDLACV